MFTLLDQIGCGLEMRDGDGGAIVRDGDGGAIVRDTVKQFSLI